jgi:hypothetical protein
MSIFKDKNLFQIIIDLFVIPADKANHFFYGAVIFTLANYVYLSSQAGLLLALFFAVGKELYDILDSKFDVRDVLWTMFGAGVACLSALTGFYW